MGNIYIPINLVVWLSVQFFIFTFLLGSFNCWMMMMMIGWTINQLFRQDFYFYPPIEFFPGTWDMVLKVYYCYFVFMWKIHIWMIYDWMNAISALSIAGLPRSFLLVLYQFLLKLKTKSLVNYGLQMFWSHSLPKFMNFRTHK